MQRGLGALHAADSHFRLSLPLPGRGNRGSCPPNPLLSPVNRPGPGIISCEVRSFSFSQVTRGHGSSAGSRPAAGSRPCRDP